MTKPMKPKIIDVAVEELVVYHYHIEVADEATDPEAIALERFRAGELPDAGPAEGEQHELSTFVVGEVEPEGQPPLTFDQWCETYRPIASELSIRNYSRCHREGHLAFVLAFAANLVFCCHDKFPARKSTRCCTNKVLVISQEFASYWVRR
jgi:hypothetical protein